jgi:glycosyltransferase involved in cell wall biosynthesis
VKVLLATHQFFPEFAAGTEVLTRSVARELIARGHAVRIVTGFPAKGDMPDGLRTDEYEFDGVRIHRFYHAYMPMGGQRSKIEIGFDNHLAAAYFARVLGSFSPDVVHFFHFNRLGTGLISRAVEAGVPAYFTPTDFWTICPTAQLLYGDGRTCAGPDAGSGNCIVHFVGNTLAGRFGRAVWHLPASAGDFLARVARTRLFSRFEYAEEVSALRGRLDINVGRLNQLSGIIAPNRMVERLLARYGVRPERIMVAAYGVDVQEHGNAGEARRSSMPLRIGFIGSLAHHKGCHVLLEAFLRLPPRRALLRIFGREGDFPRYSAMLRELAQGTHGIEFCGTFPNAQIGQVLGDLDVLVVPSLWNENTPLVVYSAQAARCPVVASDVPGIASAVRDKIDGILFEPGNVTALASLLREFVDDPEILEDLSAACRVPKSVSEYVDELIGIWQGRGVATAFEGDEARGNTGGNDGGQR